MLGTETTKERFIILGRKTSPAIRRLHEIFEPFGKVEIVLDAPVDGGIWYPDEELAGYEGLMGFSSRFPPITAWSRALYHLSLTLEADEAVWFVEDDIAGHPALFEDLIGQTAASGADLAAFEIRSREQEPEWDCWNLAETWFDRPFRAFEPLCRVSAALIRSALEFRRQHGRFTFHEVLFASLANERGMRCLEWSSDAASKHLFGPFRYRPEVTVTTSGISHPVKDPLVHEAVCAAPPAELPRMRSAKCEGWSILMEDYIFLSRHCRRSGVTRVAEFGPGDSTLAFLDAGCRVASFEHDIGWLEQSLPRFAGEHAVELVHCPEGTVPAMDSLSFEPEMVFVDGPPFREGQAMSRLQPCEWALEVCGYFLLHDARRAGEQATLEEMERRGMLVAHIPTRKGLAIVVDPARRPEMIPETAYASMSRYCDPVRGGWFTEDYYAWEVMFREATNPVRCLETGASDGLSLNLMLDHLFPHVESEAHGIDLYEGDAGEEAREKFESNAERGGHASQLHLYEGTTREILAWMIAGDGFWESFDFIHLSGAGDATEMLADACQAWSLLKTGGILILGNGERGGAGADAFLDVYSGRLDRLFEGRRVSVMKRA